MANNRKERAHNEGTEFTREGSEPGGIKGAMDQVVEMADKAVEEVTKLTKTAMDGDNTPKVAAGAALGAVAGMVLPFIAWPVAALAGAGYVAYRQSQKTGE